MAARHRYPPARPLSCFASFASPTPSLTALVPASDPAPPAEDASPCASDTMPGADGHNSGDAHSKDGSDDAEHAGWSGGRKGGAAGMCEEYVAACAAVMRRSEDARAQGHGPHDAPSVSAAMAAASAAAMAAVSPASSVSPASAVSPSQPWIELAASDVTTDISSDVSTEICSGMGGGGRRAFGSPIGPSPAAAAAAAVCRRDGSDDAAWWDGGAGDGGWVTQQYHLQTVDLTYTPPGGRTILHRVSVAAHPGQLLALAGPSGSGKTSLLDAIGCRIHPGSLSGSILVNGRPMPPSFRKHSAYVLQDDALFALLSVRETLDFAARLRLPSTVTPAARRRRVQQLLQQLGLTSCADTPVGDERHRGVSGGERRRTSIGVEVIHNPAVLLLDEPTSGLDSSSALKVVQLLHHMAAQGRRTVVLTIHQPSFRIIALLHALALLVNGTPAFHGPTAALRAHLAALSHPVPPHVNLLEFALDTLPRIATAHCKGSATPPHAPPAAPSLGAAAKHRLGGLLAKGKGCFGGRRSGESSGCSSAAGMHTGSAQVGSKGKAVKEWEYATSALSETVTLAHRCCVVLLRSPDLLLSRLLVMVAMGVIMGTLFLHAGFDTAGLQNRFAVTGFTIALVFYNSLDALPIFYLERVIFARETSRGAYRTAPYVAATFLVTLPLFLLLSLALAAPLYWLVGLAPSASAFALFVAVLWLAFLLANAFVTVLSALLPSHMVAATIASSCFSFFLLFSGFFFSKDAIPGYWVWLYHVSLMRYPMELLLWGEFHLGLAAACFSTFAPAAGVGYTASGSSQACGLTGAAYLDARGFSGISPGRNVAAMVAFIAALRVVLYVALRRHAASTRK
ncbi:hypothetical protein CLOM_g9712 [Closterium sp. NIES-68]|nr:hypothetical protein CLOM_g9712 [Closterium sp. NIES-68]